MENDQWKMFLSLFLILLLNANAVSRQHEQSRELTVTIQLGHAHRLNRFIPSHALGAGIDGHEQGDADRQLTAANIEEMRSAGLKSLAYRLRTELAGDAWHWNPQGTWSNETAKEGYWTSETSSAAPIKLSYGFRLPRRGNTIDQADNIGYSRLDDGDLQSLWKSNPYLDQHFTGEQNSRHPQWIVIDFGSPKPIDSIRLAWGMPFATRYEIQWGNFEDPSDLSFNPPGMWRTFPTGHIAHGSGGEVLLSLSLFPVRARFVRILMTASSEVAPAGSTDVRDGLGYAMREVFAGTGKGTHFTDEIYHSNDHDKQTIIYVSSTDPWHRQIDFDETVEQPGLDRVFLSGLTNGLPMLVPAELLYGIPENAAAEIQYLRMRGYPFERVELGEEPDGQFVTPEDYGALYIQFAKALHGVDPALKLGGPSFQEILPDDREQRLGNSAFLSRFLNYLKRRGALPEYSFFSFEWYPFDDVCDPVPPQLAQAAGMLSSALKEMVNRGLSRQIPWIISEYGYSAFASRAEISMEGALLNADIVGKFLSLGGDQAFLYGYTPSQIAKEVNCTAGNNMILGMDQQGDITSHFATYYGAQLLAREWLLKEGGWHEMYRTSVRPREKKTKTVVSSYAVYRPDGLWSLLLVNKDPQNEYRVHLRFRVETKGLQTLKGDLDFYQFSSKNYQLSDDRDKPVVIKSDPPEHSVLSSHAGTFLAPSYSMTVIRGIGPKP
ncbi:MAG TPA: discoidin domain-containing protein [Pyrinomonadaceae bacterium]